MINYDLLRSFEAALGPIQQPDNPFSFRSLISLDESEAYPEKQLQALNTWGFNRYFVPSAYGGALADLDDLLFMVRLLGARDLATGIASGLTFLGSISIWNRGSEKLKSMVSETILAGGRLAFSLTERQNGSDLQMTETIATEFSPGEYILHGEKWIHGNASTSCLKAVLAKTSETAGFRNFTLFLLPIRKEDLGNTIIFPGKIRSMGLRGLDLGGTILKSHKISGDHIIGDIGQGIELALISLYMTKSLLSAMSLGSLDTVYRLTYEFCRNRKLYGKFVLDIPVIRKTLAASFVSMVIFESLCLVNSHAAHLLPSEYNLISAVVKALVPPTVETLIKDLSKVLGARSFLRTDDPYGVVQKHSRDIPALSIVEGNTFLNLQYLAQQVQIIAAVNNQPKEIQVDLLRYVYESTYQPGAIDISRFVVIGKGTDTLAQGSKFFEREAAASGDYDLLDEIRQEWRLIEDTRTEILSSLSSQHRALNRAQDIPVAYLRAATRYSLVHAAYGLVNVLFCNRRLLEAGGVPWRTFLKVGVKKIVCDLQERSFEVDASSESELLNFAETCYAKRYLFSVFPVPLCSQT